MNGSSKEIFKKISSIFQAIYYAFIVNFIGILILIGLSNLYGRSEAMAYPIWFYIIFQIGIILFIVIQFNELSKCFKKLSREI